MTPFATILKKAVETTPNAIGGAFACSDGEMVDSFVLGDAHEWAVLTAHYGIVMAHLTAALNTWHHGGPEYFIAQHDKLDVVVVAVDAGYYALIACRRPANLAFALDRMHKACAQLKQEMA